VLGKVKENTCGIMKQMPRSLTSIYSVEIIRLTIGEFQIVCAVCVTPACPVSLLQSLHWRAYQRTLEHVNSTKRICSPNKEVIY